MDMRLAALEILDANTIYYVGTFNEFDRGDFVLWDKYMCGQGWASIKRYDHRKPHTVSCTKITIELLSSPDVIRVRAGHRKWYKEFWVMGSCIFHRLEE
jgi:hypothetical protein